MKRFKQFLMEREEDDFTHDGYHGTPDARGLHKDGRFKTPYEWFGGTDPKPTYWATANRQTAHTYARDKMAFDSRDAEPAVVPVRLRMKNPKHINWGGKKFRGKDADGKWHDISDHIDAAREAGHDGVVIRNMIDTYNAKGKPSTIMAVFHHENIKVKK